MKFRLIFILLAFFAISLQATTREDIYHCYLINRMPVWKNIIDQLNSQPEKSDKLLLELVNYQYGYIDWCLTNNRKDEALVYLKLAEENVKFHSPSIMGGSKSEAISYYLKAKTMMERNKDEIHGDWNYLSLLTTIAKAYESINDLPKAKLMYEEILKFEPGFTWVRDELYPQLLKKL